MKGSSQLNEIKETLKTVNKAVEILEKSHGSFNDALKMAMTKAQTPQEKIAIQNFVKESNKMIEDAKKGKAPDINSLIKKYGGKANA